MRPFAYLFLAAAQASSAAPSPRVSLSREQADSLARKLLDMQPAPAGTHKRNPPSVVFTEGEINSYLNLTLLPTQLPMISHLELRVDSSQLTASGLVDVDQVKRQLSLSP